MTKDVDTGAMPGAGRKSRGRRLLLAGAGLGLVLLAVGYWEFRARRVNTVDEVADGLGLAVVGALPDANRRVPRRSPVHLSLKICRVDFRQDRTGRDVMIIYNVRVYPADGAGNAGGAG